MAPSRLSLHSIPVYPLVAKFLSAQYTVTPFRLGAYENPYAGFLYNSLDRYGHRDTRLPRKYDRLTARLSISIPRWVGQYGAGTKLTPQKISVFNDFVRQLFFEKMTAEVALRMSFGHAIKPSVEQFLDRFGITEEELPLETALRYYNRYRQRMKAIDCCPASTDGHTVILPHERNRTVWQVEPRRGQMA